MAKKNKSNRQRKVLEGVFVRRWDFKEQKFKFRRVEIGHPDEQLVVKCAGHDYIIVPGADGLFISKHKQDSMVTLAFTTANGVRVE